MNVVACLVAASEEIHAHPLRTLLSGLSVMVGVWAVTLTVAVGDIGRRMVEFEVERSTGRATTLVLQIEPLVAGVGPEGRDLRDQIGHLMDDRGFLDRSPLIHADIDVRARATTESVELFGVGPAYARIRRVDLLAGRWLRDADALALAPSVVVNDQVLSDLGLPGPAGSVGDELSLGLVSPLSGRVVGVVASHPGDGPRIYLPIESVEQWGLATSPQSVFLVRVDPTVADATTRLLVYALSQRDLMRVEVHPLDSAVEFRQVLATLQVVLGLVAGISLVTGGIGIVNLGLAAVRQRAGEFGIRRALGASAHAIFAQVVAESLLTALAAGIAGVFIALACSLLVPTLAHLRWPSGEGLPLPIGAGALGLTVATALGLAAGALPAMRATSVSVIAAIRH